MMNKKIRQSVVLALGMCVSVCAWAVGDGVKLESETDMTSYALGYQIGGDFQRQKIELNAAAVLRGIDDARAGGTPLMTEQAMRDTLIALKRKVTAQERAAMPQAGKDDAAAPAAQEPSRTAPGNARRAAAKASVGATEFLKKNAQKEGVTTLPSGLQYRVLKDGTGKQPQATDKVALVYRGSFANGNEFGNTDQDGKPVPKTFPMDALVPGIREAVSHMKEGAQWQVFVPPELGFSASTPLYRKVTVFDLKLVAINP